MRSDTGEVSAYMGTLQAVATCTGPRVILRKSTERED